MIRLTPAQRLRAERKAEAEELRALRNLREACGMYCEKLPVEVREALHAVPEIEKVHQCSFRQPRQPAALLVQDDEWQYQQAVGAVGE